MYKDTFSFFAGGGSENSVAVLDDELCPPPVEPPSALVTLPLPELPFDEDEEDEEDGGFVFPRRRDGSSGTFRIRTLHGNLVLKNMEHEKLHIIQLKRCHNKL